MSCRAYATIGYGVNTRDKSPSIESLLQLVSFTTNCRGRLERHLASEGISNPTLEDIEGFDDEYSLSRFIAMCINEIEGTTGFYGMENEGDGYLIFLEGLPCEFNSKEKELTYEMLDDMLNKYTGLLFGDTFEVERQTIIEYG